MAANTTVIDEMNRSKNRRTVSNRSIGPSLTLLRLSHCEVVVSEQVISHSQPPGIDLRQRNKPRDLSLLHETVRARICSVYLRTSLINPSAAGVMLSTERTSNPQNEQPKLILVICRNDVVQHSRPDCRLQDHMVRKFSANLARASRTTEGFPVLV